MGCILPPWLNIQKGEGQSCRVWEGRLEMVMLGESYERVRVSRSEG